MSQGSEREVRSQETLHNGSTKANIYNAAYRNNK